MATELSVEDISLGMAVEKTVILESDNPIYNGKSIRVRALRGKEFRQLTARIKVSHDDIASNYALALDACKIAILTPGIGAVVDDMDNDIILQIGQAILSASEPKEELVEDFSIAQKGKQSS